MSKIDIPLKLKRKKYTQNCILISLAILILWWSAKGTDLKPSEFIRGIPAIYEYLSLMIPPNFQYSFQLWTPIRETFQMAILGTILATIFAIPLSFLGARNLTPNIIVFSFARFIFNSFRGISEMVFALIFISAVGMGPFPGVLALTVTFTGFLAKFFSEAIEGVDPGPIEALQAAGANKIQTIMYAIMPQVVPLFIAFILYIFEVSIRSATIVGLVGAGGIGFALVASMKLFEYKDTGAIMVAILVLVTLIDYASTRVRARIY